MDITSARYNSEDGENVSIQAVINGKEWSVPIDTSNSYYAAILEWAEQDGNEIQAAE